MIIDDFIFIVKTKIFEMNFHELSNLPQLLQYLRHTDLASNNNIFRRASIEFKLLPSMFKTNLSLSSNIETVVIILICR